MVVVGIAGHSGTGKTFIAETIADQIDGRILPMDSYYLGGNEVSDGNFDVPTSQDLRLLREHICALKQNKVIEKPIYDFRTHERTGYERFNPAPVIIVEGLWALNEAVRSEIDVKVFVVSQFETRLERRIERDMKERGRTRESIIERFKRDVEPMAKIHVEPTREYADIVIRN